MFSPVEHEYIGLSSSTTMEIPQNRNNLKTELSLGLPGSDESPEKKPTGVTIFGKDFEDKSSFQSSIGSKRVFSDVCEKWVLSINGGSDGNFTKDCVLPDNLKKGGVGISCPPEPCALEKESANSGEGDNGGGAPAKAQVVGWPPIRSFRKNTMASTCAKNSNGNTVEKSVSECLYVKVSMDGAPYLRKVDLQIYRNYVELSFALEKMFSCFISGQYGSHGIGKRDGNEGHSTEYLRTSENVLTYEDKDGDWMLVGDVPWNMFKENCRKLRIMKGSEAIGLAPNATGEGMIPD